MVVIFSFWKSIYFVGPHGHSSEVTSLDVHKNDKVFVSGGSDALVKLLHADTGQVRSWILEENKMLSCWLLRYIC